MMIDGGAAVAVIAVESSKDWHYSYYGDRRPLYFVIKKIAKLGFRNLK